MKRVMVSIICLGTANFLIQADQGQSITICTPILALERTASVPLVIQTDDVVRKIDVENIQEVETSPMEVSPDVSPLIIDEPQEEQAFEEYDALCSQIKYEPSNFEKIAAVLLSSYDSTKDFMHKMYQYLIASWLNKEKETAGVHEQ